jgi:hypothetical protein
MLRSASPNLGSKPELTPLAYLRSTGKSPEAFAAVKKLEAEYHECRQGKTMTQVTEALAKPKVTRVLPRGNFLDSSGEVVQPRPPAFLKGKTTGTSRLDLANWLTSAENPLTCPCRSQSLLEDAVRQRPLQCP